MPSDHAGGTRIFACLDAGPVSNDPSPPLETQEPAGWSVLVCINRRLRSDLASCAARDSEALAAAIEAEVRRRNLDLRVERTVCMGRCDFGPTVRVAPGGAFHLGLTVGEIPAFVDRLESDLSLRKKPSGVNDLPPPGT